jgi:hypothetical protein
LVTVQLIFSDLDRSDLTHHHSALIGANVDDLFWLEHDAGQRIFDDRKVASCYLFFLPTAFIELALTGFEGNGSCMGILPPVGMDGVEAKEPSFFNIVEALMPVCFWPKKHTH